MTIKWHEHVNKADLEKLDKLLDDTKDYQWFDGVMKDLVKSLARAWGVDHDSN